MGDKTRNGLELHGSREMPAEAVPDDSKFQALGRQILSSLYMLIRTIKIHEPDNAIFNKPLAVLMDTINAVLAREGEMCLQGVESAAYINNKLIRVDANSLEMIRYVLGELKSRSLGGFAVERPVTVEELRTFIHVFSKEGEGRESKAALDGKVAIRVSSYQTLREFMAEEGVADNENAELDSKKYTVLAYARAVCFMKRYLADIRGEGPPVNPLNAGRLVTDLVDICFRNRTGFMGLSTVKSLDEYTIYHSVNTAVMNIAFGSSLGLHKEQLSDLALCGLFHDLGRVMVDEAVLVKTGRLSRSERQMLDLIPVHTIRIMMRQRALDRPLAERIIAVYEHRIDFSQSLKNQSDFNPEPEGPVSSLMSLAGRILSITHSFDGLTSPRPWRPAMSPAEALSLMGGQMRLKFDPFLLGAFRRAMGPVSTAEAGGIAKQS